jgi:tetratricopeptide (TPR) repeat protein
VTAAQPDFADGFVYLADIAYQLEYFESGKRGYYISVVDEAAQKALSIDPYNGNARLVHLVLCIETENWSGATADIGLLRKNNPGKNALAGLRRYYEIMGFLDESVEASHKLQSLYPPSKRKIDVSINTLLLTDRYREAIDDAKDGLMRQPAATWPMSYLCDAYVGAGQLDRAREIERQYRAAGGDKPFVDECDLRVDIAAGDHAAARRILKNWEAEFPDRIPNAADIAIGYVYLGDFSEASDWFERSYDRHEMRFFDLAPAFVDGAKYRTTARWKALTQQPRFKAWQAEHDRIAAELAARGGAP